MIRIFIGFDPRETVAYHTLSQSIIDNCSVPVSITPLSLSMLPMFTRSRDPRQSNDFSFTRFLVPYLCDYEGFALFMDLDMMFRVDPKELWDLRDSSKSVQVVKHDYTPTTRTKYLGNIQYPYPRKNWSSLMLFNCRNCRSLTPSYVNSAPGLDLHRFRWTTDDMIGELPVEWNHLVSEYPKNPKAKIVHWSIGGPWFDDYRDVEFFVEWMEKYGSMIHTMQTSKKKAN